VKISLWLPAPPLRKLSNYECWNSYMKLWCGVLWVCNSLFNLFHFIPATVFVSQCFFDQSQTVTSESLLLQLIVIYAPTQFLCTWCLYRGRSNKQALQGPVHTSLGSIYWVCPYFSLWRTFFFSESIISAMALCFNFFSFLNTKCLMSFAIC